jgi:hypothetical protein
MFCYFCWIIRTFMNHETLIRVYIFLQLTVLMFNLISAVSSRRVESSSESGDSSMFESEIFEMLFTLIDFVKFKELFTDYKEVSLLN